MARFYSWQDNNLHLKVRVQPKSAQNRVVGVLGDAVKINITAPPVDGQANTSLSKYLAREFRVSVGQVAIVKGKNSRNKKLIVTGPRAIPDWMAGP